MRATKCHKVCTASPGHINTARRILSIHAGGHRVGGAGAKPSRLGVSSGRVGGSKKGTVASADGSLCCSCILPRRNFSS
eukprot:2694201-Rhodomonas_salina.1